MRSLDYYESSQLKLTCFYVGNDIALFVSKWVKKEKKQAKNTKANVGEIAVYTFLDTLHDDRTSVQSW